MSRLATAFALCVLVVLVAVAADAATGTASTPARRLVTTITGVAPAAVTVGDTATLVHAANASHCAVRVTNASDVTVYCGQTAAVTTSTGTPLEKAASAGEPGGHLVFGTGPHYGGPAYCIVATGTADVRVQATACP